MLPRRAVVRNPLQINMSLPIGDISQRGKDFVICDNTNLKFAEPAKKHSSKRSQPTCHHCGVSGHIKPHCPQIRSQKSRIKKQEPKTCKSSSKPSKPHHASRQKR
jgi:hypothetical protein